MGNGCLYQHLIKNNNNNDIINIKSNDINIKNNIINIKNNIINIKNNIINIKNNIIKMKNNIINKNNLHLREKAPEFAEELAEGERVLMPVDAQLVR